MISVILFKTSKHSAFHLIFFQQKVQDKILQLSQN